MDFVKLTKEQGMAAGKAIMSDTRCTSEVKASIKRGLLTTKYGFSYTCNSAICKKNEWYDEIMISHGVDNSAI